MAAIAGVVQSQLTPFGALLNDAVLLKRIVVAVTEPETVPMGNEDTKPACLQFRRQDTHLRAGDEGVDCSEMRIDEGRRSKVAFRVEDR